MAVNREDLMAVLRAQSEAAASGDLERVKRHCSPRMFAGLLNTAATVQMEVVDFLRESSSQDEMLFEEMSAFEDVETPESGDTAGWFGSRITGGDEDPAGPQIEYLLVRFVREEGAWKVDGIQMHGMSRGGIESATYAAVEHTIDEEMRIDGVVHEPEELIGPVEVGGMVQLSASGFRMEVVVNGTETISAEGGSSMRRITSLRPGENVLEITAETLEETPWSPEVLVAKITPEDDYPQQVFSWKGEPGRAATTEQRFEI